MNWPLFRYILTAAFRDRLFFSLAGVLAVGWSLSLFFGESSLTEQDEFTKTFAAFGLRLFGVIAVSLFVVGYIRRCFDNRDIDYLLSRPMGRTAFVLTHAAAFSCLGLIAALVLGGTSLAIGTDNFSDGALLWWASITAEFIIMANISMFFAFVVTSQTAGLLIVFAFYLLSRLMGEILGILQADDKTGMMHYLAKTMEVISVFIPRLDMMGQTEWIVYGLPAGVSFFYLVGQCFVFVILVIVATVIDMHRRQF